MCGSLGLPAAVLCVPSVEEGHMKERKIIQIGKYDEDEFYYS